MPKAERYDGPYGDIIRPVRGCEGCGGTDVEPDPDGLWCCADCGLTVISHVRSQGVGRARH